MSPLKVLNLITGIIKWSILSGLALVAGIIVYAFATAPGEPRVTSCEGYRNRISANSEAFKAEYQSVRTAEAGPYKRLRELVRITERHIHELEDQRASGPPLHGCTTEQWSEIQTGQAETLNFWRNVLQGLNGPNPFGPQMTAQ